MKVMKKSSTSKNQSKTEIALKESEQRYRTTMMSVGDGVIATDTKGRVEMMNPVAEELTGWKHEEAQGKSLEEIFHIINEETRRTVENPLRRVMREGIVVGLANHSVLIAKDGTEHPIADSGAPIRNEEGDITGMVLAFRDQTQERTAQKALQESERKFRETVKYLDEGYYSVTIDGLLLDHNQAFNRIFGFDITKDLKGVKLPDFWQNPDERKVYLQELITRGFIRNYLINAKTIGGEKIVVMANSHLVKDEKGGLVRIEGTYNDFTERKHVEEALRESQEKYYYLYENAPVGMYQTKIDGSKILEINSTACEMLGFTKEELLGQPSAVRWADNNRRNGILEIMTEHGLATNFEADIFKKDDTILSCLLSMKIYKEKGFIEGFIVDISEHKQARDEIHKLNAELEDRVVKRTAQLEASNKELEAFSYSVSHDLRAPLRHVSGYVELLNKRFQSTLSEKGQHYLNSIADSVRIMGALIDDLLQFSKTGRIEMHQSDFDMNEIVKEVMESLCKDNPDRKIEWVLGKLPSVYGDEAMLRLVWTNLLSNAVKFTRTRRKARIEIGVRKENKELVFFVHDNGVGFDMQYAQKLFRVFQRLHSTEEFEGTGIGLANVHRIVMRHGGRTWAEAEPDKGAVFYFSIPKK